MIKKVIDISHYDPTVDWDKVKADEVDGVYIKCTQGVGYIDPLCIGHATKAKAQGIKVGYYHFAEVTQDAAAEARFFMSRFESIPLSDLMPVLDIETNKSNLTPDQIESWIRLFIDTMEEPIMLYSYQPFLDQYLPYGHGFGSMPLWIAQYRDVQSPFLPKGWSTATLWQYTNEGIVSGITAKVDMNKPITQDFVL